MGDGKFPFSLVEVRIRIRACAQAMSFHCHHFTIGAQYS